MNTVDWINLVGLGLICGALGQGVRVVAGLKKLNDRLSPNQTMAGQISPGQLLISLLIGATAGALGALDLSIDNPDNLHKMAPQTVLTLLGFGYAGADFIEAFMRKA
jgi:hypothetical protein